MIRYRNNTKICVKRDITPFVGIAILSTHMTWILLIKVQEIISVFGSEFTLICGFVTMAMWSYVIWDYYLIPIGKSLSLTFLSRHGEEFVHSLTNLRDISPSWCVMCPLLDNMITLFFYISYLLVVISLSMIMMKIMLLFLYIPLQRVQIHWRLIFHMRGWLVMW